MDHQAISNLIEGLNDKRSKLMAQVDLIEREIGRAQQRCEHERDELLNGQSAWWCRHCGAEVREKV